MGEGWENHLRWQATQDYYRSRRRQKPARKTSGPKKAVICVNLKNGAFENYRGVGLEYAHVLQSMGNYNLNFWADHPNGGRMFRQLPRDAVQSITIVDSY